MAEPAKKLEATEIQDATNKPQAEVAPTTVLCVQLADESVAPILANPEKINIIRLSFLDEKKLLRAGKNAKAIFCGWDGVRGKCKGFIHTFKSHDELKKLPIYLIVTMENPDEIQHAQKTKADQVFCAPKDNFKIPLLCYDLTHEKEIPAPGQAQLTIAAKPKIEDIKKPQKMSEQVLKDRINKQHEDRVEKDKDLAAIYEEGKVFAKDKIIAFNKDEAAATTISRQLKSLGCINVEPVCEKDKALHMLRAELIQSVVLWTTGERDGCLDLVREINEARDLGRVSIVAMAPGESARDQFSAAASGLLYDGIVIPDKFAEQSRQLLSIAFGAVNDPKSLNTILHDIRLPWRASALGVRAKAWDDPTFKGLAKTFGNAPGKTYWLKSEEVVQLILRADTEAIKAAEALVAEYGKQSVDPLFIEGMAHAKLKGKPQAAPALLQKVIDHPAFNVEKSYQLGKIFLKWKTIDQLKDLLLTWHAREDLTCDHQFDFIMAGYYELAGDKDSELLYLATATAKSPSRAEYLQAMADLYERRKMYSKAVDFRKYALRGFGLNATTLNLDLAETYILSGRKNDAVKIIDEVLASNPDHERAVTLKKKI